MVYSHLLVIFTARSKVTQLIESGDFVSGNTGVSFEHLGNLLNFVAEGSKLNDSPFRIGLVVAYQQTAWREKWVKWTVKEVVEPTTIMNPTLTIENNY